MIKKYARMIVLVTFVFIILSSFFLTGISWSQSEIEERIVKAPHPVLRQVAADISPHDEETIQLLEEMGDYLDDSVLPKGGLSLPQVGVSKRGFVAMIEGEPVIMINPVVLHTGEETASLEGCLSLPRTFGYVNRSSAVKVEFHDENWIKRTLHLTDLPAFIVQHEHDHLNGILFTDKLLAEAPARKRPDDTPLE